MPPTPPPRPTYWFDACSFAELRRTYPRELFESVWNFLESLIDAGCILSIEDVSIELNEQDDEVADWVNQWPHIFVKLDEDIQLRARAILAQFPTLIDLRKAKSSADPFLIAAAAVRGGIVVSEEKPSGGPHRVKIPDVAARLGIPCVKILDVLQQEGFRSPQPLPPPT
jgi:hypothetical protein